MHPEALSEQEDLL